MYEIVLGIIVLGIHLAQVHFDPKDPLSIVVRFVVVCLSFVFVLYFELICFVLCVELPRSNFLCNDPIRIALLYDFIRISFFLNMQSEARPILTGKIA